MKCQALVWRPGERYNLSRVVRIYESGKCLHEGIERRGKLALCRVHARMHDDGLVKSDGWTDDPNTRRDLARQHKRRRSA